MKIPQVSVVSSVFNGAPHLRESVDSVLSQRGVELELIVVDDGSSDPSGKILDQLATRDPRLRVFHQANSGLTRALILGCAEARGPLIARHDSDDTSLPGRLARQVEMLESRSELSFVSCGTEIIGPVGEPLFEVASSADEASSPDSILEGRSGPSSHGSVMMRTSAYRTVGGYRAQFRFAQDWDLWCRLTEVGAFAAVPTALYRHRISDSGISGTRRGQQIRLAQIARECHAERIAGRPETDLLLRAQRVSSEASSAGARAGTDAYFIGKCLLDRRDRRARGYFARELRRRPLYARAWLGWIAASMLTRSGGGGSK